MSGPKRVLVVDDNLDLADGLSWILEAEGMEVATAYSAEEALAKVDSKEFDVVVLDFKLPGLTGFEARRAITGRLPEARCVTMSGWSVDQLLSQTLGRDSVRVLRHPFSSASLSSAIDGLAGGGLLLVAGVGEESASRLAAELGELGIGSVAAASAEEALTALDRAAPVLILDFNRPIVEMLDVVFDLRATRGDVLAQKRVILHARPVPPDSSGDDVLNSQATTGLFVKPLFDFVDVLRIVRGD